MVSRKYMLTQFGSLQIVKGSFVQESVALALVCCSVKVKTAMELPGSKHRPSSIMLLIVDVQRGKKSKDMFIQLSACS